ncbi:MAG: FHA domain-containing protein [Myxococcaceae bacterium]|nr:FHA domain-containing protein [Myxococcaceae bacterium]
MSKPLSAYGLSSLRTAPASTESEVPKLVWTSTAEAPEDRYMVTESGTRKRRPTASDPLVFELRKVQGKANPLTMGITVGRADTNDVVIDDVSISRFHAYFQQDARTGLWTLVDAESSNHTFVGPLRLEPSKPHTLGMQEQIRFGDVPAIFMQPEAFRVYLKMMMKT